MILFDSLLYDLIALAFIVFLGLYYFFTKDFNCWKDCKITYLKPLPFIGSIKNILLQKESMGQYLKNIYNKYEGEPYVGFFSLYQPAVLVRDLDIVKNVLVKDAHNFIDRLVQMDKDLDPLMSRAMMMLKGQKWKHIRQNLSPVFTSGKIKNMSYLMDKCAQQLECHLDSVSSGDYPVDIKEATAKYTTDVIASCALGIDSNSLNDPEAEFRQELRKVFTVTPYRSLAFFLSFFAPKLLKPLRIRVIDPSVNEFVRRTVWTTAKHREQHGISRRDFLDNLIELKKKHEEQYEDVQNTGSEKPVMKLEDDDYAAQAFSFLIAGFETTASTMTFALYHLAMNQEIQDKARTEIRDVLEKHNNEVTYAAVMDMKYLEMVVNETLRMYPIVPFLDRRSQRSYELPHPSGKGTVTIPAGTAFYIPLWGIQMNPEYFPEPEKFDPERFTEANKQSRRAFTYFPFGEGPRVCLGMRFGYMQVKIGLAHILSRYEVTPCKQTPIPIVFNSGAFFIDTKSNMLLSFKRIHK